MATVNTCRCEVLPSGQPGQPTAIVGKGSSSALSGPMDERSYRRKFTRAGEELTTDDLDGALPNRVSAGERR